MGFRINGKDRSSVILLAAVLTVYSMYVVHVGPEGLLHCADKAGKGFLKLCGYFVNWFVMFKNVLLSE
jgi:hypothetical protein